MPGHLPYRDELATTRHTVQRAELTGFLTEIATRVVLTKQKGVCVKTGILVDPHSCVLLRDSDNDIVAVYSVTGWELVDTATRAVMQASGLRPQQINRT